MRSINGDHTASPSLTSGPGFDDDTDQGVSKRWFSENLINVEVVGPYEDPDVIVFSCFGHSHTFYHGVKLVCYVGENVRPPLKEVPLCLSFDHVRGIPPHLHMRLPLWTLYREVHTVLRMHEARLRGDVDASVAKRKGFCSWVASNETDYDASVRLRFVKLLSQRYKEVACGGKCLNNVGGPVKDKLGFLRGYRFHVSFENGSHPGYCTEKLLHGFAAGCVPIYWGDPHESRGNEGDFNPAALISAHDFPSFDELIEHIAAVDKDQGLFESYLRQPILSESWYNRLKDWRQFCAELTDRIMEDADKCWGIDADTGTC
eukprot:CAMPEP_0204578216 /NCGR_PEP_ID=MMETSP0661-20131031/42794_1 /ASSEMBLY_ACC=CAM_ASM_000606 /TAXON_ID=109239 /ORGANISM="Alexandrium margalefi, Strain AMGDE01CS-322" /LENGTH=316 /DNA_ID=CAMNT_0051587125 /DNA_START=119 /DNA_END=1068 /DNA_ORIENTATION=-